MQNLALVKPEHMPIVEVFGSHTGKKCDYCPADAAWYHWADHIVDRDAYACQSHVGLLNPYFG